MKMFKHILIVVAIILFAGCQHVPYAKEYTTDEPVTTDIVGIYLFENQTVDYEITNFVDSVTGQIVIPKLAIYKDGKFKVENIPFFYSLRPVFSGLITKEGSWQKTTIGLVGDGKGNLDNHWGVRLIGLPIEIQNAGFLNKKPPYKIIFVFGDPDAGNVMIFKKQ